MNRETDIYIYIYIYIKDTDSNKRDNNNNDIKSGNWQLFFEIEVNIPKATIHRVEKNNCFFFRFKWNR